ncbi:MAG TPA: hypothetical protein VIV60_05680 [Polyangiaceae bacterium]
MRTPVDEPLLEQIQRFSLKYTCDCCGHFDDAEGRCSLGYPDAPHRLHRLAVEQHLLFCKEFDFA